MSDDDKTIQADNTVPSMSSGTHEQGGDLLTSGMMVPPQVPGILGTIGKYQVVRVLGEGGMGRVLLARDPVTDSFVAIKIIKPEYLKKDWAVHRFLNEARHMFKLAHPSIIRVLEVSDRDEGPYFVMPFIAGGSLAQKIKPGASLPAEEILCVARQVAEALQFAHARGIIHRDLKPSNILLDADGRASLCDFGLLRTVFNDSIVDVSRPQVEGTVPYMSPAVAAGRAEDTRCDIYGFGCLLYEMLTGQPPYQGPTVDAILKQIQAGPPRPIRQVNPNAPAPLAAIAEAAMARELRDRYAAMADVSADLDRVAQRKAPIGPHGRGHYLHPKAKLAAAAGAFALLAFTGAVALRSMAQRSPVASPSAGGAMPSATAQGLPVLPGLAAWWPGNGNAEDVIGHRKGVPFNGADFAPGFAGEAFRVNGAQYFRVPHDPALSFTNGEPLTLEAWVYRTGDGLPFHVMGKRPDPGAGMSAYQMGYDSWTVEVPTNRWTHLVVACSNDVVSEYLDGTLRLMERRGRAPFGPNEADILIGASNAKCMGFAGLIQHVRIYDRILSPDDIRFLHDAGRSLVRASATAPGIHAPTPAQTQVPFTYTTNDGAITITKYTGPGGTVTIPSIIDGMPVASIGSTAFWCCARLTNLTLPNSIKRIGDQAFGYCSGLTNVRIPNSVTSIETLAFWNCGIVDIAIPKSVTYIGGNPFHSCGRLHAIEVDPANPAYCGSEDGILFNKRNTSLVSYPAGKSGSYIIPRNVASIEEWAFGGCGGLTSVAIPNGVTSILLQAFQDCTGLTSVSIPDSVTDIRGGTFIGCGRLISIVVDSANTTYSSSADGVLFDKGKTCLVNYPGRKAGSYAIPDGVIKISQSAFRDCAYLTRVTIPESVRAIDSEGFNGCHNLTGVYFKGNAPRLGGGVLSGADKATVYYQPGTTGWGPEFGGRPTVPWNPQATSAASPADALPPPFTYTTNNGAITITKYTGPGGDVAIPDRIDGMPVTTIGNDLFWECTNATRVTIPGSVTSLEKNPFDSDTWNLRSSLLSIAVDPANPAYSVTPEGAVLTKDKTCLVAYPGARAGACAIPEGVTVIGDSAFSGCRSLTSVVIPESVTRIGDAAFGACGALASLTIPNTVTQIGNSAFLRCTNLAQFAIPPSVTSLGPNPFVGCYGLTSIVVDPANPAYVASSDGALFDRDKTLLISSGACRLNRYVVPSSVIDIGPGACSDWPSLKSAIIPEGCVSIGDWAFSGNSNLTGVTIPGSVTRIGDGAFCDCVGLSNVAIPDGTKEIGYSAFYGCRALASATIPDGVTRIRVKTFYGCTALSNVTMPSHLTSIGEWGFGYCTNLASVTIPAGCSSLGGLAFYGSSALTSVFFKGDAPSGGSERSIFDGTEATIRHLPAAKGWGATFGGRPAVGCNTFQEGPFTCAISNSAVTITKYTGPGGEVVIPERIDGMLVTEIGKEAFKQCVKLSSVAIPSGVTRIGDWAFNGCGGLTRVTMPDSVTAIGSGAFFGCTKLTGVTLPDSVTSIGDNAFFGCNSLTALAIPDSVTSIGFAAFWHCNGLTNVTLQDCVAEIGGWLFMGCGGLESICVDASNPAYASTADGILFNRDRTCIRLYPTGRAGSYVIPRTVTNVWDWAFGGCTKLSGVTIPSSVKVIRPWAFQECTGLTNVTIPNSVTFIEGNPFRNCSGLTRIDVEETNPVYSNDDDGVLFDKKRSWLLSYPAGKAGSYTLADGVIGIAHSAFQWCRYLTSVTVPESVTSVHSEAFRNCENLTAVYFEGDAPRLGRDVFEESPKARIYYQAGRKGWGGEFGGRPTSLSGNPPATLSGGAETPARSGGPVRVLPARRYYPPRTASDGDAAATQGVATAPRLPFAYTTDDGSITITKYTGPGGEVTIPRTINGLPVTSIGQRAFQRCADITSVTISSGLTTIGECAFEFCGGLTAITIPASVTSMGGNPFASGSSLTSIVVDAANPAYCSDADGVMYSKDRTSLLSCPAGKAGSYVVPDGVNSIGWLAFGGCSKLSSVTIPTSVTDIGWAAFGSCTGLTDLAIPSSVTNIGPAAVGGCNVWVDPANPAYSSCADGVVFNKDKTKLVRYPPRKAGGYVIPEGVITIADGAFNGCSMLTDVTFPESVTSIGASAFWNCSGLASLTIPDGVTSIGDSAFTSCYGLTDVALPGSVTSIGPYAFCDCPRLTSANFQGDAPGLGRGAFLDSNRATIYYQPGTKGWGPDFGGRPTAIWDPGKVRAPIPLPSKRLLDRGAVGESTPE